MLIEHISTGRLVSMDDVLASEYIARGIARRAQRRAAAFSGPSVGEVLDPDVSVVQVPADTVDVDPRG